MTAAPAPPAPQIPPGAWEDVRAQAAGDLDHETGGFLLGTITAGAADVTGLARAAATGSLVQLTLPPEAWTAAYAVLDERARGEQIVGWYHSHPGHGVFLSAYDTFIHTQFFGADGQLAIVVDPHSGEEGVFVSAAGAVVDLGRRSVLRERAETGAERAVRRDRRGLLASLATAAVLLLVVSGVVVFRAGHGEGYAAGIERGSAEGSARGYEDGFTAGSDSGYDEGHAAGVDDGHEKGYGQGYADGRQDGLSQGRWEGYIAGSRAGLPRTGPAGAWKGPQ